MAFHVPEAFRIQAGPKYQPAIGNNGAFLLPVKISRRVPGQGVVVSTEYLRVIASDAGGWEHVSVSLPDRIPSWLEMCTVKNAFWDEEDCVMQLHPPKSEHVNDHEFCLHLWRPINAEIPRPPRMMV